MPDTDHSTDIIEIDLQDVLRKLLKHRQTIITTVALSLVAALIYSYVSTPIFKTGTRILIDGKPPKIVKVEDQVMADYSDQESFFNSQAEILKSHTLAELVYRDIGNYEPWSRRKKPADKLKPIKDLQRQDSLLSRVKVTPVRMTQVIAVTVEDPDPELAARIANSWAKSYLLFSSVDQLLQRRIELETDMSQQLKYLKEKHPVIIGLKNEIQTIDERINNEKLRLSRLSENPQVPMTWSSDSANVKVLDKAQVPSKPNRPRKMMNLALALILGLFAGGMLAFLFESLDQTVKDVPDLEQLLKLSCLVAIPRYDGKEAAAEPRVEFVSARNRHSIVAESFRGLRTGIIFSNPDLGKKTFVVTSASPSEGKSTVALNLATVFAQANERTLLIDADLRNPRLHSVFKMDRANGLTDILAYNKEDPTALVRKTEIPSLDFLSCGELPPNPSELLGSKKMEAVIAKLLASYDRIIFDTPPVLAVTDAVVLSTKVDATLLVLASGSTHRQAALRSAQALRAVHARLLGVVLNMVNPDEYGHYYYYSHYGTNAPKKGAAKAGKQNTKTDSPGKA